MEGRKSEVKQKKVKQNMANLEGTLGVRFTADTLMDPENSDRETYIYIYICPPF